MNVTGQFDAYFPSVEKNSRTWMNIHAILHHARHAYVHHQSEHAQLEELDFKISNLEFFFEKMEEYMETTKVEHKTKMNLDTLIIEVEDDLISLIGDLVWFVKP